MQNKATKHTFKISLLAPAFLLGLLALLPLAAGALAMSMSPEGIIALVNTARKEAGLQPVVESRSLKEAATAKAEHMIKNDYFAHTSPEGHSPWYWFKSAGYNYKYAGENLAINYTSAKEQHAAWMNSPTHRANILNEKYQEIGVAVVEGKINGETSLVTVEMFGTPIIVVGDKTTPAAPHPQSLLAHGEVMGSQAENLPISLSPELAAEKMLFSGQQATPQSEASSTVNIINGGMALFLILSVLAAPLVLLLKTASLLYKAIGGKRVTRSNMVKGSLISAALSLGIGDSLKQKGSLLHHTQS